MEIVMAKVISLPSNAFIIDEEYGYRHHIWIDEDNKYNKYIDFGHLHFVDAIQREFGGKIIEDVEVCFRVNLNDEWISFTIDNEIPDDFQGRVAIFAKDENGTVQCYDGSDAKWIGIDVY